MKVEVLEVLELGARCREQLLRAFDVPVHGAADVEEHQDLHRVVALGDHADVEIALLGRAADGAGEIKLFGGAAARE